MINPERFTRYLTSGATVAAILFGLFYILLASGVQYLVASTVSFCVAVIVNFLLQKHFVFKANGQQLTQASGFFANSGLNLMINAAGMWVLVDYFGLVPLAGQIIVTGGLVVYNYWAYKYIFS